jgi:hypothetical protein
MLVAVPSSATHSPSARFSAERLPAAAFLFHGDRIARVKIDVKNRKVIFAVVA